KDALTGSVPLRTFGQLKQLWQAREEGGPEDAPPPEGEQPAPTEAPPQAEPNPDPQPLSDQSTN
ncbi:MAG TPA: hypothetical protein VF590_16290, partial [Isosphaeraceae bacterium]